MKKLAIALSCVLLGACAHQPQNKPLDNNNSAYEKALIIRQGLVQAKAAEQVQTPKKKR